MPGRAASATGPRGALLGSLWRGIPLRHDPDHKKQDCGLVGGGEAGEGDRAFPPGKAGGTKKKDFYVSSDSTFPWPGTAAPRAGPSAPHTLT